MTAEVLVIALVRIAGSLPVLRWPLAGGLLAVLVDLSDLLLMNVLDLGGSPTTSAWTRSSTSSTWRVPRRRAALDRARPLGEHRAAGAPDGRLRRVRADRRPDAHAGVPNVFETWFLLVALLHHRWNPVPWTPLTLTAAGLGALALKELQEWAIHGPGCSTRSRPSKPSTGRGAGSPAGDGGE